MSSKQINLYDQRRDILYGIGSGVRLPEDINNTRVIFDERNQAFWGERDKSYFVNRLNENIKNFSKIIKDGGLTERLKMPIGMGYEYNKFTRYSDEQLKQTAQQLNQQKEYLKGIQANYTKFDQLFKSYDQYRDKWNDLFDGTRKNAGLERKNLMIETQNRNQSTQDTSKSGAIPEVNYKPRKTTNTGVDLKPDVAAAALGQTGLGL